MLARCREHGTRVAVNSDAHTAAELGAEEKTRPLLEAAGLAAGQLISASPEHALAFVAERLPNKRAWEPPPT
jgi:histidinol phosphatase-like PHP family hydrolase